MKKIKNKLIRIIATTFFQPFFEKLHYISLKGMNYGSANSPENSGELSVIKLLNNELPQNPIIFDVGANNGQYLEIILEKFKNKNPTIHCFEPDNKAFEKLFKKFSNTKNVFLNNFALGEIEKKSLIYTKKSGAVDASLIDTGDTELMALEINVKTLDEYCKLNKITNIDFLKIDTEGFEMNVLLGSSKMLNDNAIKNIQLEHGSIHSIIVGSTLYRYLQILKNFKMYHIKQNGIYPLQYSPKNEIFYNSNYFFKLNKN